MCSFALSQLFQCAYFAQHIETDSEKFIESIMMSDWIQMSLKQKKLLVIFNENLKKSTQVQVAGFLTINLKSFVEVK
jgi:hypothetical protein